MKTLVRIFIAALCLAAAACTSAPSVPDRVLGVYRLYPETVVPPPGAPEGYEVFYISHYGRHGSRHLLEESQYLAVRDVLARAEADDKLTPAGKKACEEFRNFYAQVEGRAGALTAVGAAQHRAIARRMADLGFLGEGARVKASTSATLRTQKSMEAFCGELLRCCPGLRIEQTTDPALNPYSAASGIPTADDLKVKSPEAAWRPEFAHYCRQRLDPKPFAAQIFTDTAYAAGLCDLVEFERECFYQAIHFAGCGAPIDWLHLFPADELEALAQCDAYTFYQEKGPSAQTSDRTWALSAHILRAMLEDAGRSLADGTAADLRFGHDGCIMSLLVLLDVEGWGERFAEAEQIARAWDVSRIPMACNLQWVFYRPVSDEGEILVRLLLDEQPLRICVSDETGLCAWESLKRFLTGRCDAAFAILNEDNR